MGGAEVVNAGLPWGSKGLAALGFQGNRRRGNRNGPLLVGRIGAIATGEDEILPGISGDHEFLAGRTANRPAIGFNRDGPQATAGENPAVGLVHGAVGLLEGGLIGVEGIGIFHDEFAPAHQPEAGANLISELCLNLIETYRQLPVRTE